MKIKQTDYAFPFTYEDEKTLTVCAGMELRDYFAAKVMQGLISSNHWIFFKSEDDVKKCYEIADLMLKEKNK